MEEIVTIDGRQFRLTASEKAQAIADIRKQAGCGTCHQPRTLSTGGVYALPFGNDGTGTNNTGGPKQSGNSVGLQATPNGGVGPYDVRFWYATDGATITQVGTDHLAQTENVAVTDSYTLLDADIAAASGNGAATAPTDVNPTTGVITLGGGAAALAAGSIRFYTSVVDSCLGAGGRGTCAQYVDVATTCIAPTCGFVVT